MSKRSVNVINFVRGCDPRPYSASCDLLGSLKKELLLVKEYNFPSTILMCYDALIQDEFVEALKLGADNNEIGIWVEITKPLTDKLGLDWPCDMPWDWHINPSFLLAYSLEERKALMDEYFNCFKEKLGYYPRSVGSWMIDAPTMEYMSEKYDIDAFLVCREQFGVDAYTLWGGYYNGLYYPSKKNMLIPAQSKENQIGVPVIRMLGIDPSDAYDDSWRKHSKYSWGCRTLEPAWPTAKDPEWVNWYFKNLTENEDLGFSYTQTGQENSFGFEKSKYGEGLKLHLEKLNELSKKGKLTVETMSETGKWFKANYCETPATVYSNLDYAEDTHDCQSVWFSSKKYRANLYSFDNKIKIRDINLYDDNYEEYYLKKAYKGLVAKYFAYPIVDGYIWSKGDELSGLYFDKDGIISKTEKFGDTLKAFITFSDNSKAEMIFEENGLYITAEEDFSLTLHCDRIKAHQLEDVAFNTARYRQDGHDYSFTAVKGSVEGNEKCPMLLKSEDKELRLTFSID